MQPLPRYSPPPAIPASATVVIDWREACDAIGRDIQTTAGNVMTMVEQFPEKNRIHVYLPSVRQRVFVQRLQRTLLLLGCTVTCRLASLSA